MSQTLNRQCPRARGQDSILESYPCYIVLLIFAISISMHISNVHTLAQWSKFLQQEAFRRRPSLQPPARKSRWFRCVWHFLVEILGLRLRRQQLLPECITTIHGRQNDAKCLMQHEVGFANETTGLMIESNLLRLQVHPRKQQIQRERKRLSRGHPAMKHWTQGTSSSNSSKLQPAFLMQSVSMFRSWWNMVRCFHILFAYVLPIFAMLWLPRPR